MNKIVKGEKTIYVQAENGTKVSITIQRDEEANLTCGWLISETIRQFSKKNI